MIRENIYLEIRDYLDLLRRRWVFVAIPAIIVMALGILSFEWPKTFYRSGRQHLVGQPPVDVDTSLYDEEDRQYAWIASQYVVNSMTDWANGTDFALRLSNEVSKTHDIDLNLNIYSDRILAQTIRSRLTIIIEHDDEDELEVMMNAASLVLDRDHIHALPQLGEVPAEVLPIDEIKIESFKPPLNDYLALPMQVFVAALAGLGLAMFMEYLDPKIRSRYHIESIDLPFVGAIPEE